MVFDCLFKPVCFHLQAPEDRINQLHKASVCGSSRRRPNDIWRCSSEPLDQYDPGMVRLNSTWIGALLSEDSAHRVPDQSQLRCQKPRTVIEAGCLLPVRNPTSGIRDLLAGDPGDKFARGAPCNGFPPMVFIDTFGISTKQADQLSKCLVDGLQAHAPVFR